MSGKPGLSWTTVIAAYAALVSTLVAIRQYVAERPRVLVHWFRDMRFSVGEQGPALADDIVITNASRRPIQITNVGFRSSGQGYRWMYGDDEPMSPIILSGEGQFDRRQIFR